MKINFKRTQRGFRYVEFIDHNDVECRLQKSSIADDDAIWLGCNDANPRVFIPGDSWQPFKPTLPNGATDILYDTRMHLTRRQVQQLLPLFQVFAETGEVPDSMAAGTITD